MSTTASLADLATRIEETLEDVKPRPRTLAGRMLGVGADFMLAVAFFALGLVANLVASAVNETQPAAVGFVAALVGVVLLKSWHVVREHESARDELNNLARDVRLAAMIVDLTVEALKTPQIAASGDDSPDEAPTVGDVACPARPAV